MFDILMVESCPGGNYTCAIAVIHFHLKGPGMALPITAFGFYKTY